jgi:hypothetical protein
VSLQLEYILYGTELNCMPGGGYLDCEEEPLQLVVYYYFTLKYCRYSTKICSTIALPASHPNTAEFVCLRAAVACLLFLQLTHSFSLYVDLFAGMIGLDR